MTIEVAVLLSAGRHPASGRPRRAPADARALELALDLAGPGVAALHAGDPACPALGDYLGMGLDAVTVLEVAPEADPVAPLIAHLEIARPALILAGTRAENGEDSGLVPYLVAEALGYAMVPAVAAIGAIGDNVASLLQALPRGRRRALSAPLPLVATVDMAAPAPRQRAFAKSRRGRIEALAAEAAPDRQRLGWEARPARARPRRLQAASGSAAERLSAATETRAGAGQLLVEPTAAEAARAIYDYLVNEGILATPAGETAKGEPS